MKIEKVMTYYGYDLLINEVLHKRCLKCEKWYKYERELGYCYSCIREMEEQLTGYSERLPNNKLMKKFETQNNK